MSKLFLGIVASLLLLTNVGHSAVVTFAVVPTPVAGTSGMVGAFGGNSYLAKIEGNDAVANPTSLSSANGIYTGGHQLKAYVDPYPAAGGSYTVSSSSAVAWKDDVGLNFLSFNKLLSGSLTQNLLSQGEFFFSVSVAGGTGTYSISADGTADSSNYAKLKYYNGSSYVDFSSMSGNITDLASKSFMIDFKSTVLSGASVGTHSDPGLTISLSVTEGQVPEPASLTVFGLIGFAGFAARRFRKK